MTRINHNEPINQELQDLIYNIIEEFEMTLDRHNITIPSDDREGQEGEARLYGTEYYQIEQRIQYLIENYLEKEAKQ